MRRLSCIINSYESEEEETIWKSSKLAGCPEAFVRERISFFPFKDKVPKYLRSSVVYLFKCRCCSASYVGQTTRHLHTRISEHLGISPITGKHSTNPAISSILSHTNASGHPANFDDFQILSSSSDSYELMIHESLLINKYRPNLNV